MANDKLLSVMDLRGEFAEVISNWPLYRELRYKAKHVQESGLYPGQNLRYAVMPDTIELFCENTRCQKPQTWELGGGEYNLRVNLGKEYIHRREYFCRNCKENIIHYFLYWAETTDGGVLAKVGQYPPLLERIPPSLRKQLERDDAGFYEKAIRLRNHGLGIASLAYLRRVVENRTNDMLDVLAENAKERGLPPEELKDIGEVKAGRRFDDKISFAAKLMPQHLRPGGQNPIDRLHDLASDGLHSKSEDECIEIFDQCRHVFEYVFSELRVNIDAARKFREKLKGITPPRQ